MSRLTIAHLAWRNPTPPGLPQEKNEQYQRKTSTPPISKIRSRINQKSIKLRYSWETFVAMNQWMIGHHAMRKHIKQIQTTFKMSAIKLDIGTFAWLAFSFSKVVMPCIACHLPLSRLPDRGPTLIAMAETPEPPANTMTTAKSLIRPLLHNRFALGAMALVIAVGAVYLVWGGMGLSALGGGMFGLGLPLLLGESRPWTDEDQLDYDRRWKWDGSSNDDGLPN